MARNYKQVYAILNHIGLSKEEAVMDFTEGRSDSLSSLNDGEFKEFMIRLRRLQPVTSGWTPPAGDAQRKKMIGLARNMHWGRNTMEIIGMLDDWCLKQKFKKRLNDHTVAELGTLVTIFEKKVYTGYLKSLKS
ncbi:hypothetical protein [Sphingobacterium hotanense]|uniref:DUF1018 domain-containing protein n=1 Tax=Sphingobacterium hotanense TaxID=649196 RepID=A0ABT7NLB3_9SPHI|nr:hypothetical protein [Sphingobacterium hotanense]MDM1048041.1 hypothetical protein [Sphingobacterium hotanense]